VGDRSCRPDLAYLALLAGVFGCSMDALMLSRAKSAQPPSRSALSSVLAYAQGFTEWHYKAEERSSRMLAMVFVGAFDMLAPGGADMIFRR